MASSSLLFITVSMPSSFCQLSSPLPFCYFFFSFVFLRPHLQCMEVPRLEVELELQPPAYAAATATGSEWCLQSAPQLMAMLDPWPTEQSQESTCILMDTNQIHFHCTTARTPPLCYFPIPVEIREPISWQHFQQKAITELFKDTVTLLINVFPNFLVKILSSVPPQEI